MAPGDLYTWEDIPRKSAMARTFDERLGRLKDGGEGLEEFVPHNCRGLSPNSDRRRDVSSDRVIDKNNNCSRSVPGRPCTEYAAPRAVGIMGVSHLGLGRVPLVEIGILVSQGTGHDRPDCR